MHSVKRRSLALPRSQATNQAIRSERRAAILRAAAGVFARNGYVGTRIEDLAVVAGMSKGLLYHYFTGKEEVFNTLVDQAARGWILLAQAAQARPGSAVHRLRWLIEQQVAGLAEDPDVFMVVLQAMISDAVPTPARERVRELVRQSEALLTDLVSSGQREGGLVAGDPHDLVVLLGTCMQGMAVGAATRARWSSPTSAESIIRLFIPQGD